MKDQSMAFPMPFDHNDAFAGPIPCVKDSYDEDGLPMPCYCTQCVPVDYDWGLEQVSQRSEEDREPLASVSYLHSSVPHQFEDRMDNITSNDLRQDSHLDVPPHDFFSALGDRRAPFNVTATANGAKSGNKTHTRSHKYFDVFEQALKEDPFVDEGEKHRFLQVFAKYKARLRGQSRIQSGPSSPMFFPGRVTKKTHLVRVPRASVANSSSDYSKTDSAYQSQGAHPMSRDSVSMSSRRSSVYSTRINSTAPSFQNSTNSTIFYCTYPNCNWETPAKGDWIRHEEKEKHWPQKRFMCPECIVPIQVESIGLGCAFCWHASNDNDIATIRVHSLTCELARALAKTFSRLDHLREHLRDNHGASGVNLHAWQFPIPSPWPRECGFCGNQFQRWDERRGHLEKHFREEGKRKCDWKLPFMKPFEEQVADLTSGNRKDDDEDDEDRDHSKRDITSELHSALAEPKCQSRGGYISQWSGPSDLNQNYGTTQSNTVDLEIKTLAGALTVEDGENAFLINFDHMSLRETSASQEYSRSEESSWNDVSTQIIFHAPVSVRDRLPASMLSTITTGSSDADDLGSDACQPLEESYLKALPKGLTSLEVYLRSPSPKFEGLYCRSLLEQQNVNLNGAHQYESTTSEKSPSSSIATERQTKIPEKSRLFLTAGVKRDSAYSIGSVSSPKSVASSILRSQSSASSFSSRLSRRTMKLRHVDAEMAISSNVSQNSDINILSNDCQLPCDWVHTGCEIQFSVSRIDAWVTHSLTHFEQLDVTLQLDAGCDTCNEKISLRRPDMFLDAWQRWRYRMVHIAMHHTQAAREGDSFLHSSLLLYLKANNLIDDKGCPDPLFL